VTQERLHAPLCESGRAAAGTPQVRSIDAEEEEQRRSGSRIVEGRRDQEPPAVRAAGSILLVWYSRFPAASGYTLTVTS
jgi:hypothetical protein